MYIIAMYVCHSVLDSLCVYYLLSLQDKSDTYTLIVSAVLTFDSMSENTTNDRNGPASNTVRKL